MLRPIIIGTFLVSLLLSGLKSPAEAQTGRILGAAMAIAGGAMLVVDPAQPTQPTQPGIVPDELLIAEVVALIRSEEFLAQAVMIDPDALMLETRGLRVGAIVGAGAGLAVATDGTRTIYADELRPFIPFRERSPGLKYGGLALVAGGALLALLWPDSPAEEVAVAAMPGGVRASKTVGW